MSRLREMIEEELLAERITIGSYREKFGCRVQYPTTRLLDVLLLRSLFVKSRRP